MEYKFIKIIGLVCVVVLIGFLGYAIYFLNHNAGKTTTLVTPAAKPKTKAPMTFMIAGDAMFGRFVAYNFDNNVTSAFENLGENFFGKVDIGLLNLEGPISAEEFTSNPNPDNLIFNFPPQAIDALKYLGVKAVSLANNHSQNQGISGLEVTRQLLLNANIAPIGSQTSFDENSVKTFENKDYKLSIITINCLENNSDLTETIKQEKAKGNFVLVFPHWGSEYNQTHGQSQETLAHAWIDAGADLVIGSHPHVIQDAEIYQRKPIFYSLGNLIFDQSFSTETMRGLILKGEISDTNIKIEIIPTKIDHLKVGLLEGTEKDAVINKFKEQLGANNFNGDVLELKKK